MRSRTEFHRRFYLVREPFLVPKSNFVACFCLVCVSARCLLEKDMGRVCSNYESRWYYDRTAQKCAHFWYGGCEGNDNRFPTIAECEETCGGLGESAATVQSPS